MNIFSWPKTPPYSGLQAPKGAKGINKQPKPHLRRPQTQALLNTGMAFLLPYGITSVEEGQKNFPNRQKIEPD